ncbi:hypothetical protein ABG768_027471 [Culter alburnus]|uniref:Uncharacterized protein n=1 Tax=Culter alburnus TaxID=194366 RepID=A0AAW2A9S0_CULAL
MHEAIGGRPSIESPILIDSCDAEATSCNVGGEGHDILYTQEEKPCTSSGPPPPKKRRSNRVLDFLEKETEKEEERFHATHELMKSTTNRFLDLFEQLIKKS